VKNINVVSIFPTAVGMFSLERELNDVEKKFIDSQETIKNAQNNRSKNTDVLSHKSFKKLFSFINTSLTDYFQGIYNPKDKGVSAYITQSWINYAAYDESHHLHMHSNSFISGVFYIQANKEYDKIYFAKSDNRMIKMQPDEYNPFNADEWWIPVETGLLLLFPSSLYHYVDKNKSSETRISLAFNTFLKGHLGQCDNTLSSLKLR
jgi:uncharacterized protein (TIGR02466 family)